jgi:hypothetical protein
MTTRKAIATAIVEMQGQLDSEDISEQTRKELLKAVKKLRQFIKVVYDS